MADKIPEGFTPLSANQLQREEAAVLAHEHKGRSAASSVTGYVIQEDMRTRPFADNSSIQSVEYKTAAGGYAMLTTENYGMMTLGVLDEFGPKETTSLVGQSSGIVLLAGEKDGREFALNITQAAAEAGITAAGIRRTQADIAADAQVDRTEQQQIINLIARAKNLTPDR